jgi:hypothetical protein
MTDAPRDDVVPAFEIAFAAPRRAQSRRHVAPIEGFSVMMSLIEITVRRQ